MKNLNRIAIGSILLCSMASINASVVVQENSSGIFFNEANGHYYEVIDLQGSWGEYYLNSLDKQHLGLQGHLATVTSVEENQWLVDTFTGSGLHAHLFGGTDSKFEDSWDWITGEDWGYENWASGEPNNLGNEDYVEFWNNNGQWNDTQESGNFHDGFVIEYESISSVPVPGAVWLFGSALIGFVGMRKTKIEE